MNTEYRVGQRQKQVGFAQACIRVKGGSDLLALYFSCAAKFQIVSSSNKNNL